MFWAIHLFPKKPVTLTPQLPLQITQASLGIDATDEDKRKNAVLCTVNNQTHVLCSLRGAGTDQVSLNLMFESDKEFTLNVHGDTSVHLVGYCLPDEELDDEGDPASYNKDLVTVVPADLTKLVGKADHKQLEGKKQASTKKSEPELPKKVEQVSTEPPKKGEHQKAEQPAAKKTEQQQTPKKTEQQTPKKADQPAEQDPEAAKGGQTPKNKKKRKGADTNGQDTPSTPSTPATPTPVESPSDTTSFKTPEKQSKKARADTPVAKPSSAPQRKRLPNGLEIEDVVLGTGKQAVPGKKVSVTYVGRLQSNGQKFDASTTPFTFRLGVGEVIKGWDYGVAGMKIGGKRKLIIPAELAYGKRGAPPDIPPNATLVFDVGLINC